MREPHFDDTWLTPVLEQNLRQVSAPKGLWDRIGNPREPRAWSIFPLLALLSSFTVIAAAIWASGSSLNNQAASTQAFAIQALTHGPALDLQQGTLPEIRAWVKARTGLDLPLPSETSRRIRLKGVCEIKGAALSIEVAYRVSGHDAALLVSKAGPSAAGDARHRFLKCESTSGARVSSWIMRGQLYTLAYAAPGDLREECLLCHNAARPMTQVN